ncbi:hypothetical protein AC249_AIPGENE8964 [Exaiptasia diaphana]|nr:hypothetical protein AC249_AIPGENE8964 [Exaiptasia diaphana]
MDSDTDLDEVPLMREKALHLAAEVAETDDNNVPVLLLGLKDILESCPENSEIGNIIRKDLWSYDIVHVSNLGKPKPTPQTFLQLKINLIVVKQLCKKINLTP